MHVLPPRKNPTGLDRHVTASQQLSVYSYPGRQTTPIPPDQPDPRRGTKEPNKRATPFPLSAIGCLASPLSVPCRLYLALSVCLSLTRVLILLCTSRLGCCQSPEAGSCHMSSTYHVLRVFLPGRAKEYSAQDHDATLHAGLYLRTNRT